MLSSSFPSAMVSLSGYLISLGAKRSRGFLGMEVCVAAVVVVNVYVEECEGR